eukprot:765458-Hanusia_phi.AAC.1
MQLPDISYFFTGSKAREETKADGSFTSRSCRDRTFCLRSDGIESLASSRCTSPCAPSGPVTIQVSDTM